jgi:hypothetical protein
MATIQFSHIWKGRNKLLGACVSMCEALESWAFLTGINWRKEHAPDHVFLIDVTLDSAAGCGGHLVVVSGVHDFLRDLNYGGGWHWRKITVIQQISSNFSNGRLSTEYACSECLRPERALEVSWVVGSVLLFVNWLEYAYRCLVLST